MHRYIVIVNALRDITKGVIIMQKKCLADCRYENDCLRHKRTQVQAQRITDFLYAPILYEKLHICGIKHDHERITK